MSYAAAGGLVFEKATTEFHASTGFPNTLKSSLSSIGSYVVNQLYTAYGEPTQTKYQTNLRDYYLETSTSYDLATRRVTDTGIRPQTAGTISKTHYSYDDAGNILSIHDKPDTARPRPSASPTTSSGG